MPRGRRVRGDARGRRAVVPTEARSGVWIVALVLAGAGAAVYANALSAPFFFDDQNSIVDNLQIRQLSPLSVPLSPPADTPVAGRPVVNLTLAVSYALHGLDPRGFRAGNLLIHIAAALALFGLVRRTLLLPRVAETAVGAATPVALVSALVWLLHPLQTESVNYLSQRTEALMGFWYLLTLYCAVRGWTVGAVAACALGMASKESMLTAPLAVVLFDRVFVYGAFAEAWSRRRGLYLGLAATWLVLAGLLWSVPRTSAGFGSGVSAWVYLLNQAELVPRYLWLAVWPRALVLDYGLPQSLTLADVWLPGLAVLALLAATVVLLWYRPMLGFLAAWVFLTLAATSSFVPIATEVGAERRMYLSLAALAVAVTVLLCRMARGRWFVPGAVLLCLALAAGTVARNREYASRLTMAETIVERRPHGRAHFLLGTELLTAGRRDEGMAALRVSARDYPGAHFALGTELASEQKLDEAVAELHAFIAALPDNPTVAPARDMLGRVLLSQQRYAEAADQFAQLRSAAPDYRGANNDILLTYGYALAASGRTQEAIAALQQAIATGANAAAARDLLQRLPRQPTRQR